MRISATPCRRLQPGIGVRLILVSNLRRSRDGPALDAAYRAADGRLNARCSGTGWNSRHGSIRTKARHLSISTMKGAELGDLLCRNAEDLPERGLDLKAAEAIPMRWHPRGIAPQATDPADGAGRMGVAERPLPIEPRGPVHERDRPCAYAWWYHGAGGRETRRGAHCITWSPAA